MTENGNNEVSGALDDSTSSPRVVVDFFIDRDGIEYICEVYSSGDGYAEDYSVYLLLEDGSKGEPVSEDDLEAFNDEVQECYYNWTIDRFDDC